MRRKTIGDQELALLQYLGENEPASVGEVAAPEAATPPAGSCDASQVQGLVGQAYSEEAAQQAKQDANATQVRMLKPNQPITAEYLGERLNIEVDDKNLVSGVRCG